MTGYIFFTDKGFGYHYNDGDSDYVYTKEKLATYSGKNYMGKEIFYINSLQNILWKCFH